MIGTCVNVGLTSGLAQRAGVRSPARGLELMKAVCMTGVVERGQPSVHGWDVEMGHTYWPTDVDDVHLR